jgi:phage head maturation protease
MTHVPDGFRADASKPYGDVDYADPGYQSDGKKRYPLDTEAHCRAAWSYINQADNAGAYTADQLAHIKGRIKAAAKKFGIEISDAQRSAYDESLHPHAPKGTSIGGQFVASKGSGSSSSKQSDSKTPPGETEQPVTEHQGGHRGPHVHIPKGSYGYDPASNHGTGYGTKNGDPHVHKLQEQLNRLGFTDMHDKKLADDGKLGPLTTSAIVKAKRALGIKPADGIATPALIDKLAALKTAPKTAHTRRSEVDMAEEPARSPQTYSRVFELDGIEILSRAKGGDGRTVEAYAAVFNVPQEIHDQHGDYLEENDTRAFNMTINSGAAKRALPLYNHGMSVVDGRPEAMYGVPLGSPLEISADGRGLLTVTRYNRGQLADSILEAVKNGDITAQSYRGRIFRSTPDRPRGGYRAGRDGKLPKVTRMELGLSDYGPTPRPYYADAQILSVRAQDIANTLAGLDEDQRAELIRLLATTHTAPEPGTATAIPAAGTEEPHEHSGRSTDLALARQRELANWAELAGMEMATRG